MDQPGILDRTPKAAQDGGQIWACYECNGQRRWGYGQADNEKERPFLLCEGSCVNADDEPAITRHYFVRDGVGW